MEVVIIISWVWASLALLFACYVVVKTFTSRLNGWYYDFKLGHKHRLLPPGDMGWPLIGKTWHHFNNPHLFIPNLLSNYGEDSGGIYKTHVFLNPSIVICKPEICKRVLNDNSNFKLGYPQSLLTVAKTVLFEASSEDFRRFRRVVTNPIMGYNALMMFLERIENIAMKSLEEMANKSMEEGSVELIKDVRYQSNGTEQRN